MQGCVFDIENPITETEDDGARNSNDEAREISLL